MSLPEDDFDDDAESIAAFGAVPPSNALYRAPPTRTILDERPDGEGERFPWTGDSVTGAGNVAQIDGGPVVALLEQLLVVMTEIRDRLDLVLGND